MTATTPGPVTGIRTDDCTPAIDPGKLRGLQRTISEDGFFLMCALDHLSDFAELLADDPATVTFADVVRAKDEVLRAVMPEVSGVLIDALYGIGHLVAAGTVPRDKGLMVSIEDEDYAIPDGPRRTRYRENWSVPQAKYSGADVLKLLWWYRPDATNDQGREAAADQRRLLSDLVAQCADVSMPLVVEPIWYPLPGEDPQSAAWKARRVDGIVESAVEAERLGVDILKVEFPGYVDTEEGRAASAAACAELDRQISVPWVVLSAGVGYEDFATQIEIAARAGCSGYLAGRSIWRDALLAADKKAGIAESRERLARLNAIVRQHGRPYRAAVSLDDALAGLSEDWYAGWHPQPARP